MKRWTVEEDARRYPDERVVLRDAAWFKANRAALRSCAGYER